MSYNQAMPTIDELRQQRDALTAQISAAENTLAAMTTEEAFATQLHENMCHSNHMDGCSWGYETNWTEHVHASYLARARKIMASDALLEDMANPGRANFPESFIKLVRMAQGRHTA